MCAWTHTHYFIEISIFKGLFTYPKSILAYTGFLIFFKIPFLSQIWWQTPEFEASPLYTASSRTASATERNHALRNKTERKEINYLFLHCQLNYLHRSVVQCFMSQPSIRQIKADPERAFPHQSCNSYRELWELAYLFNTRPVPGSVQNKTVFSRLWRHTWDLLLW